MTPRFDIVIPTLGRRSLTVLLAALAGAEGPPPGRVLLVASGRAPGPLPSDGVPDRLARRLEVLRSTVPGPAAARNAGWRAADADWVVFVDDDVVPDPDWLHRLGDDLAALPPGVAGSQGRLRVPLPPGRRPTDWERNVRRLEQARWTTADMAYRRSVLAAVGGFDERFPRPYREDADLALRVQRAGYRLVQGGRTSAHPVGLPPPLASVRAQVGNADDALMQALHGRDWQEEARAARGRRGSHLATSAAGAAAVAALAARRRTAAAAAVGGWLAGTLDFAWQRIAPGPRTAEETVTMLLTSMLIPPAASYHWLSGGLRARRLTRGASSRPIAVLLDRDGTLVHDVPYNGDPDRVVPLVGAREALDRLRRAGIPLGVVSNQSGVGRGLITQEQVDAVNHRVDELLGPFAAWAVCPHAPDAGCACRKPAPGLVVAAARRLGVAPERCILIGDIGADVEAARAAGARAILVPNGRTRAEEVAAAPAVAPSLARAVDLVLAGGA